MTTLKLCFLLLPLLIINYTATIEGFTVLTNSKSLSFRKHIISSSSPSSWDSRISKSLLMHARPPPTSNFDLDAIEAFEKELDAQQQKLSSSEEEEEEKDKATSNDNVEKKDEITIHIVPKELHNKRIDAALSSLLEKNSSDSSSSSSPSRSRCGTMVANGLVSILEQKDKDDNNNNNNNKPTIMTRKSYKVQTGDEIHINLHGAKDNEKPTKIIPENIPLNILYEDGDIIVLNKAAGMVVHPAAGNWKGTVVNALAYYLLNECPFGPGEFVSLKEKEGEDAEPVAVESLEEEEEEVEVEGTDGESSLSFLRPGIVHRLDKGTTGVLIVAKTRAALASLSKSFANRTVKKTYVAITVGNPGSNVVIDKPIGRHPIHRQRMRVVPDHRTNSGGRRSKKIVNSNSMSASQIGRRALSIVNTLAFDGKLSIVQIQIETGRTHQIRVHLQDRRTPIYGDDVYGLPDWNKRLRQTRKGVEQLRPLLHAHRLEIDHPVSGERLVLVAPLAEDMRDIVDVIWPDGRMEYPQLFE